MNVQEALEILYKYAYRDKPLKVDYDEIEEAKETIERFIEFKKLYNTSELVK